MPLNETLTLAPPAPASQSQRPNFGMENAAVVLRMKRALKSCETSLFFKADGHQTDKIEDAHSFGGFGEAVEFCRQHKLKHTELIFRTGRPEDDLRIKIDDASGSGKVVKWWVGQTPKAED